MNNPKVRQQWIYDLLKGKPNIRYSDCFGKYSVKFGKTERTFDKDWKKATQLIKEYHQKANKAKEEESIRIEKQAVRRDILSKLEAQEILTQIARGVEILVANKVYKPKPHERIKAINELSKQLGWETPLEGNLNVNIIRKSAD